MQEYKKCPQPLAGGKILRSTLGGNYKASKNTILIVAQNHNFVNSSITNVENIN